MSELCFTQYNMHKSKKQIQTAFIMKIAKKNCEIIVLQEFWQNIYMNIIHYSDNCDFWSAYLKQFWNKACFLMCKIFSLFFWLMKYSALNIASLIMQINNQIIHIHNIYFKFLDNYTHINQNLLIFRLSELLQSNYFIVFFCSFHYKCSLNLFLTLIHIILSKI